MPALLMTAAEIAAAEALAAEILVAQQAAAATAAAAAEAVQVANAAQAAQVAQAAQAAQTGQAAQTLSAAQAGGYGGVNSVGTATNSGIQALAQEVGTTVQPTGLETLNVATRPVPTAEEQVIQAFQNAQANTPSMTGQEFLHNSVAGDVPPGFTSVGQVPVDTGMSAIKPAPDVSAQAVTHNFDSVKPFANPTFTAPPAPAPAPAPVSVAPAEVAAVAPTEAAAASAPPQSTSTLYGSGQAPTGTVGPNTYPDITAQAPLGSSQEQQLLRGKDAYGEFFDNQYNPLPPPTPPATGLEGLIDKGIAYAKDSPISTGLSAMSLYNYLNRPEPYKKPKYQSTFNASTYRGYEPTPPTPYTPQYAQYAQGGLADLGGYSDYARGGRMLKGPGDGMSDDIPATIANKQPARLANEEFVVPADVVSHLGNGSSEAGAKALYKMMDRVRQARTGNKKQGKQINPEKFLA